MNYFDPPKPRHHIVDPLTGDVNAYWIPVYGWTGQIRYWLPVWSETVPCADKAQINVEKGGV